MVLISRQANKGRLSEAGMERLARRIGLECLWETHMGSGSASRTLIIAGSALALDIDFTDNVVRKVTLAFPESPDIVSRHTEKAGAILLRDLQIKPTESPLTKKLDQFAANLERLAILDKLSVIPGLNCYEAVAGIYESLERLHKWEVERLKESDEFSGKRQEIVETAALCTKSGKPLMHARDRLGLSLDYWEEKRRIPKRPSSQVGKTWALLIECAPVSLGMYETPLSVRVSTDWISSDIQKEVAPVEEIFLTPGEPLLDWQIPEYTMLPSTDLPRPDVMEGVENAPGQKFPEVMFVAKFDPPVVVPFNLAGEIYHSTNTSYDMFQTSTFDGLMFPLGPTEKTKQGEPRVIKQDTLVPVFSKDREKSTRRYENTLTFDKSDYGRTLTELPFTHPNQLVGMLPALRQYAFLSNLLSKTFGPTANIAPNIKKSQPKENKRAEIAAGSNGTSSTPQTDVFFIDVILTTNPLPRLLVVFPFKNRTANIAFDIKLNGVVEVTSENVLDEINKSGGKRLTAADLGRMLEVAEDLGIWVEFVRRRLG